jgi:hypothetical protein
MVDRKVSLLWSRAGLFLADVALCWRSVGLYLIEVVLRCCSVGLWLAKVLLFWCSVGLFLAPVMVLWLAVGVCGWAAGLLPIRVGRVSGVSLLAAWPIGMLGRKIRIPAEYQLLGGNFLS